MKRTKKNPRRRLPGRTTDGPGERKTRKVAPKKKLKAKSKVKSEKKEADCVQRPVSFKDAFVNIIIDVVVQDLLWSKRADFTDVLWWRGVCLAFRDSIDLIATSLFPCHRTTYLYRPVFAFERASSLDASAARPNDLVLKPYLEDVGQVNLDIRPFTCCANYNDIRRKYPWNYLAERVVTEEMLIRELSRPLASVDIVGLRNLSYSGGLSRYFNSEALKTLSYMLTMSNSAFGLRRLAVKDILGYKDVYIQDLFAFLNSVSCLEKLEEFRLDIALAVKADAPAPGDNLSSFTVDGFNRALLRYNTPSVRRLPEFLMKTSFPSSLRVFSLGGPCSRVTEFGSWTSAVLEKVFGMLPKGLEELHLQTLGIYHSMAHDVARLDLAEKLPNLKKLSVTCGGFSKEEAEAFSGGLAGLKNLECLSLAYQCRSLGAPHYQAMPVFEYFPCLTKLDVRVQGSVSSGNFIQAFAESLASAAETLQDVSFRVSSRPSQVDDEDPTLLPGWEGSQSLITSEEMDSALANLEQVLTDQLLALRSLDWKCERPARFFSDIFIRGFSRDDEDERASRLTLDHSEVERPADESEDEHASPLTLDHSEVKRSLNDSKVERDSTTQFSPLAQLCVQGDDSLGWMVLAPFRNLHTLKIRNCKGTWSHLARQLGHLQCSLMQELEISSFKEDSHLLSRRTQRAQRVLDVDTLQNLQVLLEAVAEMKNLRRLTLWDLLPLAGGLYREMCQSGAQYSGESQVLFRYISYIRVSLTT